MAWYRTGNVAVTASGTVVTGAGTLFATHVRVGDGFVGPDGRMYEVTNIASETVISIFPAYLGATATGQDYSIIPVQGYQRLLADRAAGLIGQVGTLPGRMDDAEDVLAGLGTAAGADINDLLTKAGNLAGLADKAQSQLNLGVIQTLAGKALNTDNVTYQSTSNGHVWRFALPRIQVCWLTFTLPVSGMVAYGSLFQKSYTLPYPVAFVSPPSIAPAAGITGAAAWATLNGAPGLASAGLRIIDAYAANANATISFIAIGKY